MKKVLIPADFSSAKKAEKKLRLKPEEHWIKRGEARALRLFREMSERVPAYKAFLKQHEIDPRKIKTIADFKYLPSTDKNNYLKAYPRKDLCWDGNLKNRSWVISSTSGSTGEPYFFPREEAQDLQYAAVAELYLRSNFQIHQKSTLYINAFAMGVWIGGVFTYEAIKTVAERGYDLSLINPGINKAEVVKIVKNLGSEFDQVIIGSYPPILKDIIDEGVAEGLDWAQYDLGIVFSAEGFNEAFRDYIVAKAGLKNVLTSTLNHYGTVDLGTMGHETPLTILVRRLALQDPALYESIFGQVHKLPTLAQYIPEFFYFEEEDGNMLCSAYSGLPLVRYDLKDHGGLLTLRSLEQRFSDLGYDLKEETKKAGISETVWNLPLVHVYERSDFSVSFLGFQVYPETIRKVLHEVTLHEEVTGKFTMMVGYDDQSQQVLEVHVELKKGKKPTASLTKKVTGLIVDRLNLENSEFRLNYRQFPEKATPKVTFWDYEHPEHFDGKGKQKWVKK